MKTTFQKHLKIYKKLDTLKKSESINQKQNLKFKYKNNPFTKDFIFQKIQSYLLDTHSVLIQNLRHACIQRDLAQEQESILISLKEDQTLYKLFSGILAIDACVKQMVKQNNGIIISFIKATNLLFINFKLLWQQFQSYKKTIRTSQSLNTSLKIQNQQTGMTKFFDSLKFLGIIIKSSWGELQQLSQKDEDQSIVYEHMKQQIQKLQVLMQANYQSLSQKLVELQNNQQQVIISELQKENNFLKWRLSEKDNTISQYQQSIYHLDLTQKHCQEKDVFDVQSEIMLKSCQNQKANFKQIDSNFTFNQDLISSKIQTLNQQICLLKSKISSLVQENQHLKYQIHSSSINIDTNKYDSLLQQISQVKKNLQKFQQKAQIQQKKAQIQQKKAKENAHIIQTMNKDFMTEMKKYNTVFFKLNSEIKTLQKQITGKNRVIDELTLINFKLQAEVSQNKQIIQDIQNKILKVSSNTFYSVNLDKYQLKPTINNQGKVALLHQQNQDRKKTKQKQISPIKKMDVHISGGKMLISQKINQRQNPNVKNQQSQKNLQEYLKFHYKNSKELKILRQKSKQKKTTIQISPSSSKLPSSQNLKYINKK